MPRFLSLAALGMALLIVWSSRQTKPVSLESPLTVCEVLQNLDKYRGRIIEVRGEYYGGDIRANCLPLKTEGYTWFSGIQLELPQNLSVQNFPKDLVPEEEDIPQWSFDIGRDKSAEQAAAMQKAGGSNTVVVATVAGRLDARDPLMVVTSPGREPTPIGYGHLGIYPARMILVRIKDLRSEKK